MSFSLLILLFLFATNIIAITFKNPGNEIVNCPSNDDCVVTCTEENGCSTTVYCNNNDINSIHACAIQCTGLANHTCADLTVIGIETTNVLIYCDRNACPNLNATIILYDSINVSASIMCINGDYACYNAYIAIDTPSSTTNLINYPKDSESRGIQVNCMGDYSCSYMKLLVGSIDYFKLNCHGPYACDNSDIIYTTNSPLPFGTLEINCQGDEESCSHMDIVAMTAKQLYIDCHNSLFSDSSEQCKWMKIYTPLYPIYSSIDDHDNNGNQITLEDINTNSTIMDCVGKHINDIECYDIIFYTVFGNVAVNAIGTSSDDLITYYCEYDLLLKNILSDKDDTFKTGKGECHNVTYIDYNIINMLKYNNIIIRDASEPILTCPDDDKDCYIYSFDGYTKITEINCPDNTESDCILTCIADHGCTDAVIDGSGSRSLTINVGAGAPYVLANSTIYAPENGELLMTFEQADDDVFFGGVIYAEDSHTVTLYTDSDIHGDGNRRFAYTDIYIDYSTNLSISCSNYVDIEQCANMDIYIILTAFNLVNTDDPNPIPSNIVINCGFRDDSCTNSIIHIIHDDNGDNDIWNCTFIYNQITNEWSCNSTTQYNPVTPSPTEIITTPSPTMVIPSDKNLLCDESLWYVNSGIWDFVQQCQAINTVISEDTEYGLMYLYSQQYAEFSLSTKIQFTCNLEDESACGGGILFHVNNRFDIIQDSIQDLNGYYLNFNGPDSKLELYVDNDLKEDVDIEFEANRIYQIDIEFSNNNIQISLDNIEMLTTDDNSYNSGYIGLISLNSNNIYHNFEIISGDGIVTTTSTTTPVPTTTTTTSQTDDIYDTTSLEFVSIATTLGDKFTVTSCDKDNIFQICRSDLVIIWIVIGCIVGCSVIVCIIVFATKKKNRDKQNASSIYTGVNDDDNNVPDGPNDTNQTSMVDDNDDDPSDGVGDGDETSSTSSSDDDDDDDDDDNDTNAILDIYSPDNPNNNMNTQQQQAQLKKEDDEKADMTDIGISQSIVSASAAAAAAASGGGIAYMDRSKSAYGTSGLEDVIHDCMVISLGIAIYDDNVAVTLTDIEKDVNHYENTFKQKYNYKFIKNDIREKWTKDDVQKFFYECRKQLLDDYYNLQYNGLIVCISGHGTSTAIICSNGEKYELKDIRALFSESFNKKFLNLPKIFIVDACRDYNDADAIDPNKKRDIPTTSAKNYSLTILGTSEGNSVWGGVLSKSISNAFNQHILNDNDNDNFNTILDKAKESLANDTNTKQSLVISECDIDVLNKVIFKSKPQQRGSIANTQIASPQDVHGLKPRSKRKRRKKSSIDDT